MLLGQLMSLKLITLKRLGIHHNELLSELAHYFSQTRKLNHYFSVKQACYFYPHYLTSTHALDHRNFNTQISIPHFP